MRIKQETRELTEGFTAKKAALAGLSLDITSIKQEITGDNSEFSYTIKKTKLPDLSRV